MNLMEHLHPHVYIPLEIAGVDISITNAVVAIWIASFLVFLTLTLAGRAGRLVPGGLQNFMETLVQFARHSLVVEILGEEGIVWFPFIATLFFFVLYCNLLGLVPVFPGFTPTSNIWVTGSLAIVVFICTHGAGVAKHGAGKYFRNLVPGGMPKGIGGMVMSGFMLLIEIISHFARPFSLAVRLFANMTAGHLVILVFISLIFMISAFITPVSVIMATVMMAFEIFVCVLQAFIFAILASIYISLAVHPEH